METVIGHFIRDNPTHPVVNTLHSIALGRSNDPKETAVEKLSLSMSAIVNHHLQNLSDDNKADCTASILFNKSMFSEESARKVAQGVNGHDFSAVALLHMIDCHIGSLNDMGATQYASIGKPKRGQSLLNKRHHLTRLRKFCDNFISVLFDVVHDSSTAHGESIHVNYEAQL
jgi:hypothetical protein